MNRNLIIAIFIIIVIIIITIFVCFKLNIKFDKSNPIIFDKQIHEDYISIMYNNKEYVPYCAISPSERNKYLGYVREDKNEEIYTCIGLSEEEWLVSYLDSGMMNDCMLLKEKNVINIPEGITSEYEWNKKTSTESYIPEGISVDTNSIVSNQNLIVAIDNFKDESFGLKSNKSPENVMIEILEDTISKESVEILITDNNEISYDWDGRFRVQKKDDEEWNDLKYVDDKVSWNSIAYSLNKNKQLKQKLYIKDYYGKLSDGIYRIVKTVSNVEIYSNEFEIK